MHRRSSLLISAAAACTALAAATAANGAPLEKPGSSTGAGTPIQHVVVIFQENVSFDHYFATSPNATTPAAEPPFVPAKDTPTINGLNEPLQAPNNPNAAQPFRLD